jgi:hypothetical protein
MEDANKFLDKFKQDPRPEDRPASRDFKARWNDWIETIREKRTLDQNDLFDYRMSWGLTGRKLREEYLDPSVQRGILEPFGRPTKYRICNLSGKEEGIQRNRTEKKPDLPARTRDFERVEIRAKMEDGPCKHNCSMPLNFDCRNCPTYRSLKDKSFLEAEEGE